MRTIAVLGPLVLVICLLAVSEAKKDYYSILGVTRDASKKEIKRAFRKLAAKEHPDANPDDPDAEKKYMEISTAHEVLTDDDKRRVYDQHGEEGLAKMGQGGGHNPFDMFSSFFGGGQRQGEKRGADVILEMPVSLEDLYNGRYIEIRNVHQVVCPKCRGTGAKDPDRDIETCHACGGSGVRLVRRQLGPGFVQQMQAQCDKCGGKGRIVKSTCPSCSGAKIVRGEEILDVEIERGMPDGYQILFEHKGDQSPDHAAGHVAFNLRTMPHDRFVREGKDLRSQMSISLKEALIGFERTIKHLDGHTVRVKSRSVVHPGQVMTFDGEGMPIHNTPSEKGDLHVVFTIQFPESLTDEQKSAIENILSGK